MHPIEMIELKRHIVDAIKQAFKEMELEKAANIVEKCELQKEIQEISIPTQVTSKKRK